MQKKIPYKNPPFFPLNNVNAIKRTNLSSLYFTWLTKNLVQPLKEENYFKSLKDARVEHHHVSLS